jgi:HEAT repeat protein
MPERRLATVRAALLFAVILAGASCGSAPQTSLTAPSPAPAAEPLSALEIEAIAALLRLEDRREFDTAFVEKSATAAEPAIRTRAALAAGRIGSPSGRQTVRSLLADPDSAVVASAAFMAGQLRDSSAVAALAGLLAPDFAAANPTAAAEAASALGKIGDEASNSALSRFLQSANREDLRLTPVVREALIGSWRAGETQVRP